MMLLCSPAESEIFHVRRMLESDRQYEYGGQLVSEGRIGGVSAVAATVGIGKSVSAAVSAVLLARYRPEVMLLGGIAGGLDPLLKPGDAVLGIDYLQWDLDAGAAGVPAGVTPRSRRKGTHPKGVIRGDEALLELLREALSQLTVGNGPPAGGSAGNPAGRTAGSSAGGFRQGRMLTGDTLLTDPEEKLRLRDSFAGSTVDMESASVALAADMAGVPFAAVRYVFDAADGERSANYRSFVDAASSALARLWSAAAERLRQSG